MALRPGVYCLGLAVTPVWASVPIGQTVNAGDHDNVVRLFADRGKRLGVEVLGTGNLIGIRFAGDTVRMCFVTADHCLRLQNTRNPKAIQVGFRSAFGDTAKDSFAVSSKDVSVTLGPRWKDTFNVVDMATFGIVINLKELADDKGGTKADVKRSIIKALKPLVLAEMPKDKPEKGIDYRCMGYGWSGVPLADGEPDDHKDAVYVYHPKKKAEGAGIQRYFTSTVDAYSSDKTIEHQETGQVYQYDRWDSTFREAGKGAIEGEGCPGGGDSGGGIRSLAKPDELIGLLCGGSTVTFANGDKGFYYTLSGAFGLRMTADNKKWIDDQCKKFIMAPEPGSFLLLSVPILALIVKRRTS